jgi:hypothetical protein
MSTRSLEARLAKLEERRAGSVAAPLILSWHTIGASSVADAEAQRAAMIRDGRAQEDDGFLFLLPLESSGQEDG